MAGRRRNSLPCNRMQIIRWRAASIKSAPKPTRFLVRLTKVGAFSSGTPTLLRTEPFGNVPKIGAILNIRGIRNGCKRRLIEPTHRAERDVVPVPLRFCLDSPDMYVVETLSRRDGRLAGWISQTLSHSRSRRNPNWSPPSWPIRIYWCSICLSNSNNTSKNAKTDNGVPSG